MGKGENASWPLWGEKKTEEEKQWAAQYYRCQGLSTAESTCSWGGQGHRTDSPGGTWLWVWGGVSWGSKENPGPIAYGQASLEQAQNPRTSHIILIFSNKQNLLPYIRETSWRSSWNLTCTINKCFPSFLKSTRGKKIDFLLMGHGLNKLFSHDPQHNDLVHTWNQNKRPKYLLWGEEKNG